MAWHVRVLQWYSKGTRSSGETASGSSRRTRVTRRALCCSAGPTGVWLLWYGTISVSYSCWVHCTAGTVVRGISHGAVLQGTHRALPTLANTEYKVQHTCACSGRTAAAVWHRTTARAVRLFAGAAPTPAPSNPGDTTPPTSYVLTLAPNAADPTGKSDAKPSAPLPPQAAQCIYGIARGLGFRV